MSVEDGDLTIYQANRSSLPKLNKYFSDMWKRREFSYELAKSTLRSQHAATFFGQMWLVLNPLMLAVVYYFLMYVISGGKTRSSDYFPHLLAGLFIFYFVSNSVTTGASSVTSVGKLVSNQAFPRLLLPLSSVLVAFRKFAPTIPIYFVAHAIAGLSWSPIQLLVIPAFILIFLFAYGTASLMAVAQVYFRDVGSFLPYLMRVWLYLSPVLYYADQISPKLSIFMPFNPLFGALGIWSDALVRNTVPPIEYWVYAGLWSFAALLIGCGLFISKEREFAVRI